jgi:hypothetical protein
MVDTYVIVKLETNLAEFVPLVTDAIMAIIVTGAVQLVVKIASVISMPERVNVNSIFKVIIVIVA